MIQLTCAGQDRKQWIVGVAAGGALAVALLLGHAGVAQAADVGSVTLTPPEQCRFLQENIPEFVCDEQWAGPAGSADPSRSTEGAGVPPFSPDDVIVGLEIALY